MIFFREHAAKHHFFSFTEKGSLFSLYYFHSYYPAYLVWNLFLTTHCDKFCTWKSPAIPTFYTNNPYFFTTPSKFLSLLFPHFFVEGHLKDWGLKSRGVICISMWLEGGRVAINFGFPAGVSCFNCPYNFIKISSLTRFL